VEVGYDTTQTRSAPFINEDLAAVRIPPEDMHYIKGYYGRGEYYYLITGILQTGDTPNL
jgi:hypothetical protein